MNIDIQKNELEVKIPHTVQKRTLSTESFDEPLIFVKNKLLADKSKHETEDSTCEYSKSSKNSVYNSSALKNENFESKCKSSVAEGSANTSQGNSGSSNVSNENKNVKDTRSDGNESNSANHGFNNSLSNSGTNNKSYLNMEDTSNSDNTSNSPFNTNHNTTLFNQSFFLPANLQSTYNSVAQQNNSINPKLKEIMRKKRDKAEVDAEIKRRLAEIDELEKLARSQHANVMEKIGARTRSRTLNSIQSINIEEEDDVVSISSDDSQGTSVGTNEATNACSKMIDIGKSEDLNEEPTTTQEELIKPSASEALAEKGTSSFSILFKGSVSILPVDTTQRTKTIKASEIESDKSDKVGNSSLKQMKNDSNISKFCVEKSSVSYKNKKDNLVTEKPIISLPPHVANNVTLEVYKNPSVPVGEQIPTSNNELSTSVSLNDGSKKPNREVVSVYQFRESDESEVDEEILPKQKYSRVPRKRAEIKEHKNKMDSTLPSLKKSQQEKTIRKTRHRNISDKCKIISRDSSPLNIITNKNCEVSQKLNDPSDSALSSNIIPEPDSSTSLMDTACNRTGNETPTNFPEDTVNRSSIQGDETNSVVSSNNTSQESDMIPSSPARGFKQPYRKSLVNRRKRKRRSYFGRCLIPSNNLENQTNESFGNNNDHNITQSEEVVSSSVNTLQIPQDKKQRRRRKTVMDLLMEDSMLSVTRDFPMSPNPYMFSSFYKDIDIPSKPNVAKESTVVEQNVKKIGEDRGLPIKPDFLAQKLRILEKLKSISRKNRQTRQCRTLVCYNEDSLPESLVESPVGESVPNSGDGGTLSQDISPLNSLSESTGECSNKSLQEPSVISKDHLSSTVKESGGDDSTFESLNKVQKPCLPKTPLKRGRKSKVIKNVENKNDNNECKTKPETNFCIEDDSPKEKFPSSTFIENKDNYSNVNNNQSSACDELSEFDKLLESKPKDSSRIKLPYDFDPGSPRSPSEDKSDDAPDDFFSSLPSPRQSSDDDLSENSNDNQYLSLQCTPVHNTDDNLKEHQELRPERIICSILKTKIGKMLPYFGDTSSDEGDDLDEDIPLSLKLTQFGEEENEDFESNSIKEEDGDLNLEVSNSIPVTSTKRPAGKRRRKKLRRLVPLSNNKKSVRSTRSKSAYLGVEEIISNDTWGEANKKGDITGDSHNLISNTTVQLRKSNRKLKTANFLCKEIDDDKSAFDVVHDDEGGFGENTESDLISETLLYANEAITRKKKGRPSKTKLVKENNSEKDKKQFNELTAKIKHDDVETEYTANSDNFQSLQYTRKRKCPDVEYDDNSTKTIDSSAVNNDGDDDDDSSVNKKDHEQTKLQLSDLVSAIQKSISLKRTRAKGGKGRLELETNIEETSDIQTPEIDFEENTNEDCSLEDLPLNKRAVREIKPVQRGKKENLSSLENSNLSKDDTKLENFSIREDSYLHNKNERDLSPSKCFNDAPPSLIRTRARRAKLITSENNDLDPPSLETSIPLNIDNNKDDGEDSLNTDTNLNSNESMFLKDSILPLRKRGRKPKNNDLREQNKSEALLITPNEISAEEPKTSKMQETEEITQNKSDSIEMQPLPKKRGRRGKRKITRRKNMSSKDTNSDDDSEVEINFPEIVTNDDSIPKHGHELDSSKTNAREEGLDVNDGYGENTEYSMQEDGRKRKRIKENKEEIKIHVNPNELSDVGNDNNSENDNNDEDNTETKKRMIQDDVNEDKTSAPGTSSNEPSAYPAQSCANQPFLWNKISAFLNKTTRSVGTQVKVKNMVLKGFETSEPEVSLQSELTLPQVIKTLFEELRFIDSSFSNP